MQAMSNTKKLIVFALAIGLLVAARAGFASEERADKLFETALASFKMERWEEAGTKFYEFMAAAPNDPRNDHAQYCAARAQMHRKYLNKAIEEFSYLIDDFPTSNYATLALFDRAQCCFDTREPEKGYEDYDRLTKIKVQVYHGNEDAMRRQLYENHRHATYELAKYHIEKKDHDQAVVVYQRLPNELEAFRCVVDVYYSLGKFDQIRDMIDRLQGTHRHEAFKFLIEFYAKSKAINQLKSIFSKLLEEKDPTDATDDLVWTTTMNFRHIGEEHVDWALRKISAHYLRMARRADYELAKRNSGNTAYIDDLELFVLKYRNGPDVDHVLRMKGILLERTGKGDDARKTYRRISNAGLGHWYAAETYDGQHSKKDYAKAVNEFEEMRKAFYSQEWSAIAQWRIAEIHRRNKKVDEAVEAYRQVIKRFGNVSLKDTFMGAHHYDGFRVQDREFGPEAQLALSDVLREADRFDDAIMEYRVLRQKYAKSPCTPVGSYNVALCYEGKEDTETAINVLKQVLRLYPKTRAASDAHTRLESKYKIPDEGISDGIDFFGDTEVEGPDGKNYLEDPSKLRGKNK